MKDKTLYLLGSIFSGLLLIISFYLLMFDVEYVLLTVIFLVFFLNGTVFYLEARKDEKN